MEEDRPDKHENLQKMAPERQVNEKFQQEVIKLFDQLKPAKSGQHDNVNEVSKALALPDLRIVTSKHY